MNSITSLIPRARAVYVDRLGTSVLVGEFTLNDLADLQEALDLVWKDPLAEAEAEIAKLDATQEGHEAACKQILAGAYEAAEAGPPVYGEASAREYFETREGRALLLWVALRRHNPKIDVEQAAAISLLVTPSEFAQIWRIAHGASSLKAIERLLGLGLAQRPSQSTTWGELIEEVYQSHPGWTYADVYGLTLSEFVNARRLGKPEMVGIPIPMDGNMIAKMNEFRAQWDAIKAGNSDKGAG